MQESQISKILVEKLYQNPEFQSCGKMPLFLEGILNMKITNKLFKIIRILIRYFGFPVAIKLKPIYDKLSQNFDDMMNFDQDIKLTAGLLRLIIKQQGRFPSLSFIFSSGYKKKEDLQKQQSLLKAHEKTHSVNFMNFCQQIQILLLKALHVEQNIAQKCYLQALQKINIYLKSDQIYTLQIICLKQYKTNIQKYLKQTKQSISLIKSLIVEPHIKKSGKITLQTDNNNQIFINDTQAFNDPLCCRRYFYKNQIINQPENIVQQYKQYRFPYDQKLQNILLKTICGFLNGRGGIIYIGIKEDIESKKRKIEGAKYNQSQKQEVLKYFRRLGQKIQPEIVKNQKYKLQFVPIKDNTGIFIPGDNVLRLKIDKGQPKQLYSFINTSGQYLFAFRTQNQVLVTKMGQKILQIYKAKLQEKDNDQYFITHKSSCKQVDRGIPIYDIKPNDLKRPPNKQKQFVQKYDCRPWLVIQQSKFIKQLSKYKCQLFNIDTIVNSKLTKQKYIKILPSNTQELNQLKLIFNKYNLQYIPYSFVIIVDNEIKSIIQQVLFVKKIIHRNIHQQNKIVFVSPGQFIQAKKALDQMQIKIKYYFDPLYQI